MSGLQPQVTVDDTTTDMAKVFEQPTTGVMEKSPLVSKDPNAIEYETDARGRKIGVKKLNAIDRFDMTIMLGQSANIEAVVNQAALVAAIVHFDNEKWSKPANMLELRARLTRLDFDGINAAVTAIGRLMPDASAADTALKNS